MYVNNQPIYEIELNSRPLFQSILPVGLTDDLIIDLVRDLVGADAWELPALSHSGQTLGKLLNLRICDGPLGIATLD